MTSVSPSFKSRIENQQSNVQMSKNSQQMAVGLSQKADTVEISKNTKQNKTAKYIGIGVALAGAFAVSAFLLTKGKTCLLEFNAKKAQKYAEGIQEKAEKLKNEVVELFNSNGMKNGNKVANIIEDVYGAKTMEEFASDGVLIRRSFFGSEGNPGKIEVQTKKGVDRYRFREGKLSDYAENYQVDSKWNESYAKGLYFEEGKLYGYVKNFQEDSGWNESFAKGLYFEEGKLSGYVKNCHEDSEGIVSFAKGLYFEEGKLSGYVKNCQEDSEGIVSFAKGLYFEEGKLSVYAKNCQIDSEGNTSAVKEIEFTPGKPLKNLMIFLKSFFKKD